MNRNGSICNTVLVRTYVLKQGSPDRRLIPIVTYEKYCCYTIHLSLCVCVHVEVHFICTTLRIELSCRVFLVS